MQGTENPAPGGTGNGGGNGESDLINPTKNAPKNQSLKVAESVLQSTFAPMFRV